MAHTVVKVVDKITCIYSTADKGEYSDTTWHGYKKVVVHFVIKG